MAMGDLAMAEESGLVVTVHQADSDKQPGKMQMVAQMFDRSSKLLDRHKWNMVVEPV